MITIIFDRPEYEYDVHSLVKAFFPQERVGMFYTCSKEELDGAKPGCPHIGQAELRRMRRKAPESEAEPVKWLCIDCERDRLRVSWESRPPSEISLDPSDDRIAAKRKLGRALYDILREETGKELPWGTLVGIRPTKIAMKLLEEGSTEAEIAACLKREHRVSDAKTALAIDIAKRERALLAPVDYAQGYSLYVGIPFCPTTCLYCSFPSYPLAAWREQTDAYLDALEKEVEATAEWFRGRPLNTVYIGGGTPTTLSPAQLRRLIGMLRRCFPVDRCLEFTVEAGRPDSITEEKLAVLRECGIDRISINPQTMKQETLDLIGRHHTVAQTVESFRLARSLGFSNINMDLILGLPGEELSDVADTLRQLRELMPDSLTVHSLAIKRAARLTLFREYYEKLRMVNTQEHMELCERSCREMGLKPYYLYRQKGMAGNLENVGYAREGREGLYNILIMEEKQTILALGAGATTKLVRTEVPDGGARIERVENVKDVGHYLTRVDEMIARKEKLFVH